jgi:hypothetical protein
MNLVQVAPFGGTKQSGLGREGSKYGIDEYLEVLFASACNCSPRLLEPTLYKHLFASFTHVARASILYILFSKRPQLKKHEFTLCRSSMCVLVI